MVEYRSYDADIEAITPELQQINITYCPDAASWYTWLSRTLVVVELAPTGGMTRVNDQTDSTDPAAVNSRIFVGNLNTHVVSKEDVERLFKRYGRIIGLSKHKGYAFVQYTDAYDARNAVLGEDGRTIAGQILDVNMVSESKPHDVDCKRQNLAPDLFATPGQLDTPVKRARAEPLAFRPASAISGGNKGGGMKKLRTYAEPHILICGNCREVFPSLQKLLDHKRLRCRLRFTCRCHVVRLFPAESLPVIQLPICVQCLARCGSWWELTCPFETTQGYHHPLEAATNSDEHHQKSLKSDKAMTSPNHDGGCEEAASLASDCRSDDWASIVVECASQGSNGAHSAAILSTRLWMGCI
ncbi:hypothetical protein HPB51_026610 [Rhipicephalus microplus]|uniref:RRM domain-containing protein n=1 Tax=Rhipicephalus microplus TaxID=6941 RepID=A0A9J6D2M9_RHIMP|nr:hypothetical protein HPB51_026610 [Rhipicephalus microplus]